MLTLDVLRAVNAAAVADRGILPLGGGMLDQTASFDAACRSVWNVEASIKNG